MGGMTFVETAEGADLNSAFSKAVASARWSYGNDGYTGTLAEKDAVVQVYDRPVPLQVAQAMADGLIEQNDPRISDKWGPAGAIPLSSLNGDSITVEVTLRNPELHHGRPSQEALASALPKSVTQGGKRVFSIREMGRATCTLGAPTVDSGQGRAVTRYTVDGLGGHWDTLAAARQAAVDAARTTPWPHDIHVRAVLTREDGNLALLTVKPKVKKYTTQVQVVLAGPATTRNTPTEGWLFFGWASS